MTNVCGDVVTRHSRPIIIVVIVRGGEDTLGTVTKRVFIIATVRGRLLPISRIGRPTFKGEFVVTTGNERRMHNETEYHTDDWHN